jgi:hypothetical protein
MKNENQILSPPINSNQQDLSINLNKNSNENSNFISNEAFLSAANFLSRGFFF